MAKLLTPVSLWKNFDDSLETMPVTLGEKVKGDIKYEYVNFFGRETGRGRVTIYGVFASNAANPSSDAVLILPDSTETVDEQMLKLFVDGGYSALMVDYCGKSEGTSRYTEYPSKVSYANAERCDRRLTYVDETADRTSWYEWVAVGIYARKYLIGKLNTPNIGVVGIRNGGEVAWKLITAAQFSCAVIINACGWTAYRGYPKFGDKELVLNEERYRYIAGIDSQSYAPYVKCPVLMLCSANDPVCDYDRAYDTFARINPAYRDGSVIAFSLKCKECVGEKSTKDMFMFLDGFVKQRFIFIPRPVEVEVFTDEEGNLAASASFDQQGIVESCGMYYSADSSLPYMRDWIRAVPKKQEGGREQYFYIDAYEKTKRLYVLCYARYSNSFTVWSKIIVKDLQGKFKNSRPRRSVLYSSRDGQDCFTVAEIKNRSIGGIIFPDSSYLPSVVTKDKNLKGIYSECGLFTNRINNPEFAPKRDSILKFDVCPDINSVIRIAMKRISDGEEFSANVNVIGGVWQSIQLESKMLKTIYGKPLTDYTQGLSLLIECSSGYAINNVMWF